MNEREKLVELLNKAIRYAINNCKNKDPKAILDTPDVADYLLAHGVTVQRWIPVTEWLPDKQGFYLVASKYGTVGKELFHRIGDDNAPYFGCKWVQKGHYTHWMPLPEPPKGE